PKTRHEQRVDEGHRADRQHGDNDGPSEGEQRSGGVARPPRRGWRLSRRKHKDDFQRGAPMTLFMAVALNAPGGGPLDARVDGPKGDKSEQRRRTATARRR